MIPEGRPDHGVAVEFVECLAQGFREGADPPLGAVALGEFVGRPGQRIAGQRMGAHTVGGARDENGKGEVGVARRVRAAHLEPRRTGAGGHPDERVCTAPRPHGVDGRVPRGDEPLVRVDGRVAHCREGRRVCQQTPDREEEVFGELAVLARVVRLRRQRTIHVDAAPGERLERLRHERRVEAVARGDVLRDGPYRHQRVRGRQDGRVLDVDFVLSRAVLVVRARDRDAHRLECRHHLDPCVFAAVAGREVEVRSHVGARRERRAVDTDVEEVELHFERSCEAAQHVAGILDGAPQRRARAALERLAVGRRDVADDARLDRPARRPGVNRERREVGAENHVRLLAAHEPVDRPAVERDRTLDGAFQFAGRDRYVLADAEDVDKREAHEAHLTLARDAQDVALR